MQCCHVCRGDPDVLSQNCYDEVFKAQKVRHAIRTSASVLCKAQQLACNGLMPLSLTLQQAAEDIRTDAPLYEACKASWCWLA